MTTKNPEAQHHYFATTAFGWATAATRAEAIASVARNAGSDIIKRNLKPHGGLYCWSCRVDLPMDAHYSIDSYMPSRIVEGDKMTNMRVPIRDAIQARIQNVKGHVIIEDKESDNG